MNKKLILAIAVLIMAISISSVSASENSTDLASIDDEVLQDSDDAVLQEDDDLQDDDAPAKTVKTKIVADSITGEDGDSISVVVEIWDENDEPVMNGTASLVMDGMVYGSFVENGIAVFDVSISEGMTKAYITYFGNEYYDSSELEIPVYVVHETYSEIPIGDVDDSLNVASSPSQPATVRAVTDSEATGNPIFAILLSLMIISSTGIINRKR